MIDENQKDRWRKPASYVALITSAVILIGVIALSMGLIGEKASTTAPGFAQEDIDGQMVSLDSYKGKPVVLDFFATWCIPCGPVTESLVEVSREFSNNVVILSISIDPIETKEQIQAYKDNYNAKWQFLTDESNLQRSYDVHVLPKMVIVDQDGQIAFAKDGSESSLSRNTISSELHKILEGRSESVEIISRNSIIAIALLAGVVSFFAPCAFPLLPGYLSYTVGHSQELLSEARLRGKLKRASLVGGASALGLLTFIVGFGLILVFLGASLLPYVPFLEPLVGFALIISGILLISNYTLNMNWFFQQLDKLSGTRIDISRSEGPFGIFLYGIGYGAATMGCSAPIFLALILSATAEGGLALGMFSLIIFATAMSSLLIGAAVVAAFTQDTFLNRLKAPSPWLKTGSGIILIVVGVYLILFFIWSS
ncbi:MAG: cytochrome c biogenesis protein CcdA [Candidatus Heimdallarchaeota archaeon]